MNDKPQEMRVRSKWAAGLAASLMALILTPPSVMAGTFPDRPIRWIVPWGPGSTTDTLARLVGNEVSKQLNVPVIIENKAGADGNIGAAYVASSPADGYVLMLGTTSTNSVNITLQPNLPYDPQRDFRGVAKLASIPNVLVVGKDTPITSVSSLIEQAKTTPYSFASTGAGGTVHLSGELFKKVVGVDLLHVPYKAGSSLLPDLLTGRVDMMFCNVPLCLSQIQSGNLRALGITSAQRSASFPDVPTLAEQGVEGFNVVGWYGVFVPANVPDDVVSTLNTAFNQALQTPQVANVLNEMGATVDLVAPRDLDALAAQDRKRWADVIAQMSIQ